MSTPERCLVVWCPDWPVLAAATEAGVDPTFPVALIEHGLVHACTPAARATGVQRGLKVREAQSRCAALVVLPLVPAVDARRFEPVLAALESGIPTVQVVRPGLVVIRAPGAARFFGGERAAAGEALRLVAAGGAPGARAGVADGPFTAEQAARATGPAEPVRIVPPGGSAAFLAPLPVALPGMPALGGVLAKLGVRSLGAFAALGEEAVRDRFGAEGEAAHRVAAGLDPRRVTARVAPADRDRVVAFEPPLDRVDQIAFAMKRTAEDFVGSLAADLAVCTSLTVELADEHGGRHRRTWLHPRSFTPLDVIDRVRWQLAGAGLAGTGLAGPVAEVVLHPEAVDAAADHEQGLWGGGPDERIHHALSRVQSMLGHEAVLTVSVGGGRMLADRRAFAPWGEQHPPSRPADRPWPGRLPGFTPTAVLTGRQAVQVRDPAGRDIAVDERGAVSGPPAELAGPSGTQRIDAWAGPWPVDERWWDAAALRVHRLQATTADGAAWLLCHDAAGWWLEGHY